MKKAQTDESLKALFLVTIPIILFIMTIYVMVNVGANNSFLVPSQVRDLGNTIDALQAVDGHVEAHYRMVSKWPVTLEERTIGVRHRRADIESFYIEKDGFEINTSLEDEASVLGFKRYFSTMQVNGFDDLDALSCPPIHVQYIYDEQRFGEGDEIVVSTSSHGVGKGVIVYAPKDLQPHTCILSSLFEKIIFPSTVILLDPSHPIYGLLDLDPKEIHFEFASFKEETLLRVLRDAV